MAKNTMADLRNHLFAILEDLNDKDVADIDKDRIKLSIGVSNSIINSAKVEVEYHKAAGTIDPESRFFNQKQLQ